VSLGFAFIVVGCGSTIVGSRRAKRCASCEV
jgi:hypothetical protein